MKTSDLEIPDYLLRFPLDPEREAAVAAAWDRRWAEIGRRPLSNSTRQEDNMVSLVRLDLAANPLPDTNLGTGKIEARVLAVGEQWARFEVNGTPRTVKRETWDAIPKETLMMNVLNSDVEPGQVQTTTDSGPTTGPKGKKAPAGKKAGKKAAAPAPEATNGKGKGKKVAAAPAGKKAATKADGKPTNKSVMMEVFKANVGKPVAYEKLCMAVYKVKDNPGGFAGVLKGCEIASAADGYVIERAGKGAEATYTYKKKRG